MLVFSVVGVPLPKVELAINDLVSMGWNEQFSVGSPKSCVLAAPGDWKSVAPLRCADSKRLFADRKLLVPEVTAAQLSGQTSEGRPRLRQWSLPRAQTRPPRKGPRKPSMLATSRI